MYAGERDSEIDIEREQKSERERERAGECGRDTKEDREKQREGKKGNRQTQSQGGHEDIRSLRDLGPEHSSVV